MTKKSLWRLMIISLICGVCAFFFIPLSKVRLGLDLKGGVRFELEVQSDEALEVDLHNTKDIIQSSLQEHGFNNVNYVINQNRLSISNINSDQIEYVKQTINNKNINNNYYIQFDQNSCVLQQKLEYQNEIKNDANKRAIQIIETRVNQFGVAEPEITAAGINGSRIIIELPGIGDSERERIKKILITPGHLEQRLVAKSNPSIGTFTTKQNAINFYKGTLPQGTELLAKNNEHNTNTDTSNVQSNIDWILVEEKTYTDGRDIIRAEVTTDQFTGLPNVSFTLNKKGSDNFATLTEIAANEQRLIAIILDKKIISILNCKEKIIGGSVSISGKFTKDEANDLALKLKSGAMVASIKFLEEHAIGPSLGADSIRSGIKAALISFITIMLFMIFYYKWSGVNAIIALLINIVIMVGLLASFNAVITLPGIAGFALTIGMAVDANILIFERIREELNNGQSVATAIEIGFNKVFWTIVDSHVTQLFAAILLFIFGTGPVKGFAVTLTIGVGASLFTSVYISRFIYDWILERNPIMKKLSI